MYAYSNAICDLLVRDKYQYVDVRLSLWKDSYPTPPRPHRAAFCWFRFLNTLSSNSSNISPRPTNCGLREQAARIQRWSSLPPALSRATEIEAREGGLRPRPLRPLQTGRACRYGVTRPPPVDRRSRRAMRPAVVELHMPSIFEFGVRGGSLTVVARAPSGAPSLIELLRPT